MTALQISKPGLTGRAFPSQYKDQNSTDLDTESAVKIMIKVQGPSCRSSSFKLQLKLATNVDSVVRYWLLKKSR